MIGVFDRPPMLLVPGSLPTDADLVDRDMLNLSSMAVDRNGKPSGALRRFDPIAVPPTALSYWTSS